MSNESGASRRLFLTSAASIAAGPASPAAGWPGWPVVQRGGQTSRKRRPDRRQDDRPMGCAIEGHGQRRAVLPPLRIGTTRPGGERGGSPALTDTLKDKHGKVRHDAAVALGQIGPRRRRGPSRPDRLPERRGQRARQAAAWSLGYIGSEATAAVPALGDLLRGHRGMVRHTAAGALGRIGAEAKPAVPALVGLLKDHDERVRDATAWALGRIGPAAKEAVPALIDMLKDRHGGLAAPRSRLWVGSARRRSRWCPPSWTP